MTLQINKKTIKMENSPGETENNERDDHMILALYGASIALWILVSIFIFVKFEMRMFVLLISLCVSACLLFNYFAKNHSRFELTSDMFVFSGISIIASSLITHTSKFDTIGIALILGSILSICLALPRYNSVSKHRVLHFKNNCLIIAIGLTLFAVVSYFERRNELPPMLSK